jgi:hypothetical protein
MTLKKKTEKSTTDKSQEQPLVIKTNNPLVFISHDTRDVELAEEFSNLLKSASAGALKSFRSSDKKGTQGIEYGLDWYPAFALAGVLTIAVNLRKTPRKTKRS